MALSADGKRLAVATQQSITLLTATANGKLSVVKEISEGPDEINQIAFSADGSTLLSAGKDRRLRFWSWATGLQKKEVLLDAPLGAIAVARNGRIAVGSDKDVVLLDKAGKELKRLRGHDHQVTSLAFSSDSQSLVSGSLDWTALVWDMP